MKTKLVEVPDEDCGEAMTVGELRAALADPMLMDGDTTNVFRVTREPVIHRRLVVITDFEQ